ncbi:MAG: 3-dehydroquinate synthase family protein [Phycisphaerales bacterium JB059]
MTRSVRVELRDRAYEVRIGSGALAGLGEQIDDVLGDPPKRRLLVVDRGVPEARADAVARCLASGGVEVTRVGVTPSEPDKSIASYERLLRGAALARLERTDQVIALGGGIVGDLAGFVAASYRRGLPVVQAPSTLLSMVDASVGGKTGVNLSVRDGGQTRLLKNFVGAFHQPRLVVADIDMLASLDPRVFRAGLGECVKHALIAGSEELLGWTEANAEGILEHDPKTLTELVTRNVGLKARVVAGDERESAPDGGRALLNLGHTFAHAIETLPDATPAGAGTPGLEHGEAVAIGLAGALRTAERLGLIGPEPGERVGKLLERFGLPARAEGLPDADRLLDAMVDDKKTVGGSLRLILPDGVGSARVVRDPDPGAIRAGLRAIGAP